MKEAIRKYALQNAIRFDGKANPGNIVGKVIGDDPKLKSKMEEVMKDIQDVVKKVNSMSVEEQTKELMETAPELLEEKKVEKKVLKDLKNAKKVIMRFEPSPSGPMHMGHAYSLSINSEYCKKYKGKLILRISDTNPENIYEPAYELLPEDGNWVTKNNIKEVVIQSDRLGFYYDYAEKLVDMGKGYVCECDSDSFRTLVFKKEACPCRDLDKKEHQLRYAKMFSEYKPGEAVLRIKTDIAHPNPAMRDFPLMRVNEHTHPKTGTKNKVWPLMNLAVFVDDVELGVTHIVRAKDHIDNARRQEILYDYFKKKAPESVFLGMINFEGLPMSCSKVRVLIEEGKYNGWDDIRLPFLLALKRRGYQPEAFINYSLDVGVTQNDKTVSKDEFFKQLNHFNKEAIESTANRFFFIKNPIKIKIEDAPGQEVELNLHPDNKKGGRKFKTSDEFYIDKEDLDSFEDGELIRLMDCLNFVKSKDGFTFDSVEYEEYKSKGKRIIHWLPVDETVEVSLLMDDNKLVKGLAEKSVENIKEDTIIQFERVGFCRCDKPKEFWFGHR